MHYKTNQELRDSKFFGNFLVARGLIAMPQLIKALIDQANALPTAFQIIFDRGLLTDEQWLNVFEVQASKQVEFISACRLLEIWTNDLDAVVNSEKARTRLPLGLILLKMKAIDLKTLTGALDEFLSKVESVSAVKESVPSPSAAPSSAAAPLKTNASQAISKDHIRLDSDLVKDFTEFFTQERIDGLKNTVMMLTNEDVDEDLLRTLAADCRVELHTLKGVAVCLRLASTVEVLNKFESILAPERDLRFLDTDYKMVTKQKFDVLSSLLEGLSAAVAETLSEEEFVKKNETSFAGIKDYV